MVYRITKQCTCGRKYSYDSDWGDANECCDVCLLEFKLMRVNGKEVHPGCNVLAWDGETVRVEQVVTSADYPSVPARWEPYIRGRTVEKGGTLTKFRAIAQRNIEKVL